MSERPRTHSLDRDVRAWPERGPARPPPQRALPPNCISSSSGPKSGPRQQASEPEGVPPAGRGPARAQPFRAAALGPAARGARRASSPSPRAAALPAEIRVVSSPPGAGEDDPRNPGVAGSRPGWVRPGSAVGWQARSSHRAGPRPAPHCPRATQGQPVRGPPGLHPWPVHTGVSGALPNLEFCLSWTAFRLRLDAARPPRLL